MKNRWIVLAVAIGIIIGAIAYLEPRRPETGIGDSDVTPRSSAAKDKKGKTYPLAKELVSPTGFVNAPDIKLSDLIGKKVVLVDFWTYSCINCQRTTPYLNAWYEKYRDQGFEIVGVHTPEFDFEKNIDNVRAAVQKLGIAYPVALDNDFGTWRAYGNQYWPHKYLVDIDGFIVYDHIGEGNYDETEREIQQALAERMSVLGLPGQVGSDMAAPAGVFDVDFSKVASPETYFGSTRNQNLGNGTPGKTGEQSFPEIGDIRPNTLYLSGSWNIRPEYGENTAGAAKIVFRYSSKNVYMVASSEKGVTLSIRRDGKPLGDAGGKDAEANTVEIQEDRLYHIIENPEGYGEHILEITIENPGLRAFTLTFG